MEICSRAPCLTAVTMSFDVADDHLAVVCCWLRSAATLTVVNLDLYTVELTAAGCRHLLEGVREGSVTELMCRLHGGPPTLTCLGHLTQVNFGSRVKEIILKIPCDLLPTMPFAKLETLQFVKRLVLHLVPSSSAVQVELMHLANSVCHMPNLTEFELDASFGEVRSSLSSLALMTGIKCVSIQLNCSCYPELSVLSGIELQHLTLAFSVKLDSSEVRQLLSQVSLLTLKRLKLKLPFTQVDQALAESVVAMQKLESVCVEALAFSAAVELASLLKEGFHIDAFH
eukprot:RCo042353